MEKDEVCDTSKGAQQTGDVIATLPESFLKFLKVKGIPIDNFVVVPPRYIRLKPKLEITQQQLSEDLGMPIGNIERINDFYRLPAQQTIHHSKYYAAGQLYGMDMSSGYAVKALDLKQGLDVLELCCAPGNKLMYARDLMDGGSITGVDINQPRMEVTRSLIKKYGHEASIRLFCEDATTFKEGPREGQLYDRVLVDAECTHEGSLKHLKKFLKEIKEPVAETDKPSRKARKQFKKNNSNPYTSQINSKNQWTQQDFEERFLDPKKLEMLHGLQTALIENGYKMLKPGGRLVYSTCSFDRGQNEEIVEALLQRHPNCALVEPFSPEDKVQWEKGDLKYTVRFTPKTSNTGGLFIAAILKN